MLKAVYNCRGSISVFLVLIMLPMFVCAGLCVDASKVSVAKSSVSGAGDLAMNAALSEYDEDLKDLYGLFANSKDMSELQKNVSRYFENTINGANVLDSADSYTRNFVDGIVANMFTGGESDFNNVVVTRVEEGSFQLSALEQSAIAKPDIMKRQILDYMQYKAPVNLGKGLLTKLGCLGDVSKQSTAMEKQMDYQDELKKVDDVCKDAYDAIKKYNETYGSTYGDISGTQIIQQVNQSIEEVRGKLQEMTKYKIADNSLEVEKVNISQYKTDNQIKKDLEKKYGEEDTVTDKLDKIKAKIDEILGIKYNFDFFDFLNTIKTDYSNDLESQISYIKNFNGKAESYSNCWVNINTYIKMYDELYEDLKEDDEIDDETKENYKYLYKINGYVYTHTSVRYRIQERINTAKENVDTIKSSWNENVKTLCRQSEETVENLVNKMTGSDGIINKLNTAIDKVKKIKKQIDKVNGSKNNWKTAINNLSDGTVKSTMSGDYEGSAKELNVDAINKLQTRLEKNKAFFEELKKRIEGMKFADKKFTGFMGGLGNGGFIKIKLSESELTYTNISNSAQNYVNENYLQTEGAVSDIDSTDVGKITNDEFYSYLEKNYQSTGNEDSGQKEQAKNNRKAIVDKGNEGAGDEAKKSSNMTDAQFSNAYGDNDSVKQLNATLTALSQKASEASMGEIKEGESDKCKKNLSAITKLFEGLNNLLTNARDNLYLEEYMTEIFSCYTDSLDATKVSGINPQNKLSEHVFYGSEVEYLIFGKNTPKENLTSAKGLLFALRLVLNTIYAFTASDIRSYTLSVATAIAGWTGFGVPIVQTILTFALGMAESVIDVNALCEGDSVALYKNKNTWVLSPTNLAANLTETLAEKAKGVISNAIDDVTAKIEKCANDSLNSLLGEGGAVTKYINTTTQTITDKVKDSVISPLQTKMTTLIGGDKDLTQSDVEGQLNDILDNAILGIYSDTESVLYKATAKAVAYVKSNYISNLAQFTVEKYNQYKSEGQNAINSITQQMEEKLNSVAGQASAVAKEAVSAVNAELQSVVSTAAASGSAAAKQQINDAISDYTSKINHSKKVSKVTENNTQDSDMSVSGSGFTMNYKEYMKVFCLLHLMTSQEGMLNRTTQLIQANLAGKGSKTNLAKAYTMLQVSAKVKVKTAFLDVVSGSGSELDYSNLGKGYRTIQYKSAYGY